MCVCVIMIFLRSFFCDEFVVNLSFKQHIFSGFDNYLSRLNCLYGKNIFPNIEAEAVLCFPQFTPLLQTNSASIDKGIFKNYLSFMVIHNYTKSF